MRWRRAALLRDKGRHFEGGDEKIVKDNMSRHNFAERGGDVLLIYVFKTDIHIIGLEIGLKRHTFVSKRRIIFCLYVFRDAPLSE